MIKNLAHIAIVVKDLDQALAIYASVLGLQCESVQELPAEEVKAAFLKGGDSQIELVQPVTADSGVARFLAQRGEGIHHICLEVDDLDATLRAMAAKGLNIIGMPRQGVHGRVAFVHPKSAHGVLVELLQREEQGEHSGD